MMYGGYGWGWMMLMPLVWIVLIGAIVWAVVRLAKPSAPGDERRESPQDILDRRLASGEIDAEAYQRIRDQLSGREPRSP